MLACSSPAGPRADGAQAPAGPAVLEISAPVYDATGAAGDGPALEAQCKAWSLTREQAETFFRLSKPITGEEKHGAYYDLPCSVKGRLQAEGRTWDFAIDGAATSTWTSGAETRSFGCSDPACEPLVLMMPRGPEE